MPGKAEETGSSQKSIRFVTILSLDVTESTGFADYRVFKNFVRLLCAE